MTSSPTIRIADLVHRYGERVAVDGLSFDVASGEIFALLGPNGSGKTTLFRVLSTLIPLQSGTVEICGRNIVRETQAVRGVLGVVFQAASLDRKLTVAENLRHQGRLYGLRGQPLRTRIGQMLERLGLADRAADLVETLSGGLRRRVELAKGMLHRPQVLLLDEPSTGLDPGARADMWRYLETIRRDDGVTILLTTHLLEEADRADRLGIVDAGKLAALDTPAALRAMIGGDSITIRTADPESLARAIRERFDCQADVLEGIVRLEQPDGHQWVARLAEAFGESIETITLGRPTLEDVFIDTTGHQFWEDEPKESTS